MQLQPAFRQQLAQDIGDKGVGADEFFALVGGVAEIRKELAGAPIGLHGRPGQDMRAFFSARQGPRVIHAGDILLADVAAHRVQVFELKLVGSDLDPMHGRPTVAVELAPLAAIERFIHAEVLDKVFWISV